MSQSTPLLWRAFGPRAGDGPLFLLGSVHLGRPGTVDFGPAVAEAYAACDELVVEVDLAALSEEEIARQTAVHAVLADGRTLRDVLSPETHALLDTYLRDRGIPMASVEQLKPWAVTSWLVLLQFESAGLEGEYGVDKLFIDRAAGELPIRGLETLQSQLKTFDELSPSIQDLMLADALARIDEDPSELLGAWERGDETAMVGLVFGPLEEHPEFAEFYEVLFFARNEAMAAKLAGLVADGKQRLVVLGAGHMLGPRGIPALLASRGFRIERVGRR
jgi:hypothetical protein